MRAVGLSTSVRFGEADLTTCDREPIHIPGSIQPHGLLLVLERRTGRVEQAAGDCPRFLGFAVDEVIGRAVDELFDARDVAPLHATLGGATPFVPPRMCLQVRCRSGAADVDLTFHTAADTAILEIEPWTQGSSGTPSSLLPLKAMVGAVQHTATRQECCSVAAAAVRAAMGFDRAMVYRFLPDGSGIIEAEDANPGLERFLGLHYPASDIPQQARELYLRNWLRAIPTIDYVPASLYPKVNARTGVPLDMSHCNLRSVSPIHLEYLRNMGIRASLSASIVCQERLWGMLVLHHYSPRYVSAELRAACEVFAQIFSLHVDAKVFAHQSRLRAGARAVRERLLNRVSSAADLGQAVAQYELLDYVDARGAVVLIDNQTHVLGVTPPMVDVAGIVDWLNRADQPLIACEHLAAEYPPAESFPAIASGVLAIGLSRQPRDYVIWFRPELGRTVRWAGNPEKPALELGQHGARLTPRGSFAEWLEISKMHCAAWSQMDVESAEALRVALLEQLLQRIDRGHRDQQLQESLSVADTLRRNVDLRTEQLKALTADLEGVEDRERRQIAHDLHDDIGQTLAAAQIRLTRLCEHEEPEVVATATVVRDLLRSASTSIRSLATQLTPEVLHEIGLSSALDWLAENLERVFGLTIRVVDDDRPKPLSHEKATIIYRAVRELLINVAKHAHTDSASVDVRLEQTSVVIRVSDGGSGYAAPGPDTASSRGFGLVILRERIASVGGRFESTSVPGQGTVALLAVPLDLDPRSSEVPS
jgi:light-regulated signal transduction histidine kinase (bacteriophytochrome)